jgi:predicted ATPase/class 3 adenylate cyclase
MHEFPTGILTLVFTDIQGSSDLWEEHRSAFHPVLEEHNRLMREIAAKWNGVEVKTEGDAFFLVFARASDAVRFAVEAQIAFGACRWDSILAGVSSLCVRMGLHTGEPILSAHPDGAADYFGPTVNRAARVGGAGHGAQIVVSDSTRALALPELPGDISFFDLGTHRLKGVGEEHLWQILHPALPRNFPLLKTLNPTRHNLPLPRTPFIGRAAQIEAWSEILLQDVTRLLTLLGFGGMGKTRSALQLAALCAENYAAQFPDGVWWIELDEAHTGDAMILRIASSLRLQLQPQPSAREQLWSFLRERETLLVLDNLEQIPDAATVVNEMLKEAPRLKCVATSRRPLGLQAERQVEVPPLLPSEATLLFHQRAQSHRTSLREDPTKDVEADIQELCRRLEGVPLAIELAATRAALMTPREMLGRLDERFRLLQSRAPDLPPRQRALRGTIDWSYELLGEEDKALFAQLSVFAGGFTLHEAEAIRDAYDVLEGVQELRNQSLLRAANDLDQSTRYFMLESLRDYASEKLHTTPEIEATVQARHAAYFERFAKEHITRLRSADEAAALREFEAGVDNVRAALNWAWQQEEYLLSARLALRLGTWLQRRGLHKEAMTCFDRGLEALNHLPGARRSMAGELLRERTGVHLDMHQWAAAREAANESLSAFEHIGDARGMAQARNLLGWVCQGESNLDAARVHFAAALQGFEEVEDRVGVANVHNNLGTLEYEDAKGDKVQAERHLRAAQESLRAAGDARGLAAALTNLGALAFEASRVNEACQFYREALLFQRELGDIPGIASSLFNLGEAAELQGRQGEAQQARLAYRLLAVAERLFDEVGSPHKAFARELGARVAADLSYAPSALDALQNNLRNKSLDELLAWALPEKDN